MSEKHPPEHKGAARPSTRREGAPGERRFGKPASGKPASGERRTGAFGKPASGKPASGERRTGAFGKPASGKPASDERKTGAFGKPAPGKPASGERRTGVFGKPASGVRRPSPGQPGERRFGRPAPASKAAPLPTTGLSTSARRVALSVLQDVDKDGAYASLALQKRLTEAPLSQADKRLCTSIVYGTLENRIRIDFALDHFMTRPTQDPLMRNILRLSAYQMLFLDRVPESAAVNEGVNLVKLCGMESAAGFANAVLRNLAREKASIPYPKREDDARQFLHIMESMPLWIVDRLVAAYGAETAEAIIRYRPDEHAVILRPNLMKLDDAGFEALLAKKVWKWARGLAPHAYVVTGASDLGQDRDFRGGLFSIQGQASMLAAQAVDAKPGMRVLDACAAPGGKACYLAEAMQGTGRVFAWELHEHRAQLIEGAKRRLGLENLRVTVRDAAEPKPDLAGTLDAVLLDAPCTGLGVMLEKPDVKLRAQESSVAEIADLQRRLLDAVCEYVKPGGTLVYSTCSILPEENAAQIEAFLARHAEFSIERLPASLPERLVAEQTPLGLQLLSCRDGVEGFYIARMRKRKTL